VAAGSPKVAVAVTGPLAAGVSTATDRQRGKDSEQASGRGCRTSGTPVFTSQSGAGYAYPATKAAWLLGSRDGAWRSYRPSKSTKASLKSPSSEIYLQYAGASRLVGELFVTMSTRCRQAARPRLPDALGPGGGAFRLRITCQRGREPRLLI
jgi:hypothetical protein